MGVYIKDMEMPKECWSCPCMANFRCNLTRNYITMDGRLANCPLIELQKHGRLIDKDALGIGYAERKAFIVPEYADGWNSAIQLINNAPTVIDSQK